MKRKRHKSWWWFSTLCGGEDYEHVVGVRALYHSKSGRYTALEFWFRDWKDRQHYIDLSGIHEYTYRTWGPFVLWRTTR